jgi:hypothetical protein
LLKALRDPAALALLGFRIDDAHDLKPKSPWASKEELSGRAGEA